MQGGRALPVSDDEGAADMMDNGRLDAEIIALDAKRKGPRIKLMPFNSISLTSDRRYLVKGVVPYPGLTVIWGPPNQARVFGLSTLLCMSP